MYIELHLIQNFAPSNLNRDDTNNPKDCEFGGVRRARISSQCIKRAIRQHPAFASATAVEPAHRTRYVTRLLSSALIQAGKPAEQAQAAAAAFAAQFSGLDKKNPERNNVLIYISDQEVQAVVAGLLEGWDTTTASLEAGKAPDVNAQAKELFKTLKERTSAPDIAMFGRMLAEKPELNLDAACQVAHALSTHRVSMEMDFFTAVDDLSTDEETGAGMMGVTGFNSACFYRYARLDWDQLLKNLDGDVALARRSVAGFLRAAILAVPTGKQNSFAAQNPPDFALLVTRQDGMSWSLANAFEKPVTNGRQGLVNGSIAALDRYWGGLQQVYGGQAQPAVLCLSPEAELANLRPALVENFDTWVNAALSALPAG